MALPSTHRNHSHNTNPVGTQPAGGVYYLHPAVIRDAEGNLVYVPDASQAQAAAVPDRVLNIPVENPVQQIARAGQQIAKDRTPQGSKARKASPAPKASSIAEGDVNLVPAIIAMVLAVLSISFGFFPGIIIALIAMKLSKWKGHGPKPPVYTVARGLSTAAMVFTFFLGIGTLVFLIAYGFSDGGINEAIQGLEMLLED